MKRHKSILFVLLVVFWMGATAHAQTTNPDLVGEVRLIVAPVAQTPQEPSVGEVRLIVAPVTQTPQEPGAEEQRRRDRERELERAANLLQRYAEAIGQQRGGARSGGPVVTTGPVVVRENRTFSAGGAWWTNTALVERLGLTDDQKTKIERTFENHRLRIVSSTELLEKEEAQLKLLLEAEPIDRNAILTQTDRVIQARGEMERANAAMTLEMRETLTRAQWTQLPQAGANIRIQFAPAVEGGRTGGRGGRGAAPTPPPSPPAPGTPGQRRGPGPQ